MSKRSNPETQKSAAGPAGPTGFYSVSLPNGPVATVAAGNETEAWEAYCRETGVVRSKHQPVIAACEPPELPEPPAS